MIRTHLPSLSLQMIDQFSEKNKYYISLFQFNSNIEWLRLSTDAGSLRMFPMAGLRMQKTCMWDYPEKKESNNTV